VSAGNPGIAIRGARVLLRHPVPEDEVAFAELVAESEEIRASWVPGPRRDGGSDSRRWLASLLRANAAGNNVKLFICRLEDGALLGCMNVNEVVRGAFLSGYLGYWIGGPYARRGYAGEALRLVLRYAFGELGLHRLEANIQPGNEASIALVRSAGFRLEGLSPRYLYIAGAWRDHERWAITVEDVASRSPPQK